MFVCYVCVGECSARWWNKGGHSEVIRMEGRKFLAFLWGCGGIFCEDGFGLVGFTARDKKQWWKS